LKNEVCCVSKNTALQCYIFEAFHIFKCRLTERSLVESLVMQIHALYNVYTYII